MEVLTTIPLNRDTDFAEKSFYSNAVVLTFSDEDLELELARTDIKYNELYLYFCTKDYSFVCRCGVTTNVLEVLTAGRQNSYQAIAFYVKYRGDKKNQHDHD
ncbi:unnamed protein product, partial [Amoebophrya sp. A25]|eukprot:GSA25T00024280001.1